VIHALLDRLPPGVPARVVDLGCGPGADAAILAPFAQVVGLDASPRMVTRARARGVDARVVDLGDPVALRGALTTPADSAGWDGALSNFGALNCLADLRPLAAVLAATLPRRAPLVVVVMGRRCPAEDLALLRLGRRPRRRDGRVTVGEGAVPVRYLDARTVAAELAPSFRLEHHEALGLLDPPPDLGGVYAWTTRLEPRIAALPWLRDLGDHHLLVFRRA
jgi:SAM-dependent methyltransferase